MGFFRQRQILEGKSAENLSDDMEGRKFRRLISIKPSFPRHWQIIRHHLALTKKNCDILASVQNPPHSCGQDTSK